MGRFTKVLVFLLSVQVLFGQTVFAFRVDDEGPKPWTQYASDHMHSSNALGRWDFNAYDKESWKLDLKGVESRGRNPVVDQGRLFIGDSDKIYCIDVFTGNILWSFEVSSPVAGSCAILGDTVIAPMNNRLLGLSTANGEVRWYNGDVGDNISSPTVYKDDHGGKWMYFTTHDGKTGRAYKYSLNTGRLAWKIETEWPCPGAMGVNSDYGYVGCATHYKASVLDDGSGGMVDGVEVGTQSFSATMAFDKYCICTMSGGEIIALPRPYSKKDPKILDTGGMTFAPPCSFGDTLIIGDDEGRLVRFDIEGKIIWDKKMPGPVTDGCTVMGDYVLVPVGSKGSDTAGVYIVDGETGEQVKKIPLKSSYVFQPIVAWDRMFVEHGESNNYRNRTLSCFGKPPRTSDQEPKIRVDGGKINAEVGYKGETTRQITITNEGKIPLELVLLGDSLLFPSKEILGLAPKEKDTIRVAIKAGNRRPGKYNGQMAINYQDPDYGKRTLAMVTASVIVLDKPPEQKDEPPNPPVGLSAKWMVDHVELFWSPPQSGTEPSGYNIFRAGLDGDFPKTPLNKAKVSETFYSDYEVKQGQAYRYRVQTVGKNGLLSDPGNETTVEIPIRLEKVGNLVAKVQGGAVTLTWESEQEVEFLIERNGEMIGSTFDKVFTDPFPPKTKLFYKVFPTKDGKMGPEALAVVDLTPVPEPVPEPPKPPEPPQPKKIVIVFSVGKDTATVDGKELSCQGTPYVKGGRTMVPFRFLGESIGAEVSFEKDPATGRVAKVSYSLSGKTIVLPVDSRTAVVNGKEITLDAPPEIKDGRTYVPLRFVTDALGGEVSWDAKARQATITYTRQGQL
jgi:outer membrane protein assembly factor BamB